MNLRNNHIRVGLALGSVFGFYIAMITVPEIVFNGDSEFIPVLASLYPGYSASLIGVISGVLGGFIDAFIIGTLGSMFYQALEPYFES